MRFTRAPPVRSSWSSVSCCSAHTGSTGSDHRSRTRGIEQIPNEWLDQARDLAFHYAHTSHGSQIMSGLQYLASQDPRYALFGDFGRQRTSREFAVHPGSSLRL